MQNQSSIKELSGGLKFLTGICFLVVIAMGFILMLYPGLIAVLFPIAVTVHGFLMIIRYFSMKDERNGWTILSGLLNIAFGLIMFFGSTETRVIGFMTLEVFFAIWAIVTGFSNFFSSFGRKKREGKSGFWTLIGGALTVICGFLLLTQPAFGTLLLFSAGAIYVGIAFIFIGVAGLAATLTGKNAEKADGVSTDGQL